jgi:pimeloyl-ACP methyl ester carboxylesterase
MQVMVSPDTGHSISYLDEGRKDWRPVVFVGGGGTSGRVFALLEFLRTTRENLELRFIAVERNGFGATPFDDSLDFADYAGDVEAVLEQLEVENFSLFAISGGGPYAATIATRNQQRLISLHLASTLTWFEPESLECLAPSEALVFYTRQPMEWFGFPPESPIHGIPGFQDAAFDDAARTFNLGGQSGDPAALYHELQLYCANNALPDLGAITVPSFLYYGEADDTTPPATHLERWQDTLANSDVTTRLYPGEGHDAQYRHLDQILVDLAGMRDRVVICTKKGKTRLAREKKLDKLLDKGATLGTCAWRE